MVVDENMAGLRISMVYGADYNPTDQTRVKIYQNSPISAVINTKQPLLIKQLSPDLVESKQYGKYF